MDEHDEVAARAASDVGGQAAGPFLPSDHVILAWEKRCHAMLDVLAKHGVLNVEEKRRGVDELGRELHDKLTYYERWILAACNLLVAKGVISSAELAQKMAEVQKREGEHGREVCR